MGEAAKIRVVEMATTEKEEEACTSTLMDLPDDVIYSVLFYCDIQSLGRLSAVCKRLATLVRQECVWVWMSRRLTIVHDSQQTVASGTGRSHRVRVQELCRRSTNWKRGHARDVRVIHHAVKQIPWLQHDGSYLWISYKNLIRCYQPRHNGHLQEIPEKTLPYHTSDVSRFVVKDGCLLSGSRSSGMCCHSVNSGDIVWSAQRCHNSDIQAVDFHNHIAISGSRDATVKLWDMTGDTEEESLLETIHVNDRVWSITMNPDGRSFASGTAGINYVPPLRIWDTQSGQLLGNLGARYKNGAGVLDIQYETPYTLLSCGYDTSIRMWDLRCSLEKYVSCWVEPFDSTIYSVRTDGQNVVLAGTARHGMVRLWDKRMTDPVQVYYIGKTSSPVYAMAFNSARLYVALDKGINMLDFGVRRTMHKASPS